MDWPQTSSILVSIIAFALLFSILLAVVQPLAYQHYGEVSKIVLPIVCLVMFVVFVALSIIIIHAIFRQRQEPEILQ